MSEQRRAAKLDAERLRELLERWDSVASGPEAFAVHHEIMTYLLEGMTDDEASWWPLRRLLYAVEHAGEQ